MDRHAATYSWVKLTAYDGTGTFGQIRADLEPFGRMFLKGDVPLSHPIDIFWENIIKGEKSSLEMSGGSRRIPSLTVTRLD